VQSLKISESTVKYFYEQLLGQPVLENENTANIGIWIKKRILLQDSLLHQIKFCWATVKYRFIPGESDFELIKLPKGVFFIYYLMKPFRSIIRPLNVAERKRKLVPVGPS
jgi:hypothetical protein